MTLRLEELRAAKRSQVLSVRPTDRETLAGWVRAMVGVRVPMAAVCPHHRSPLDYLEHVFFERPGDALVWANRGGGKTFYGAVATLLDLIYKPGIEVRVLGGSMQQSSRMYEHLRSMLEREPLRSLVAGSVTDRGVRLRNGSRVELLAQSETSVRGSRVQKLRCDEVELFGRDIWRASQFVTRSAVCGGRSVRGSIEALSTAHKDHGLMHELIGAAREHDSPWRLFTWCALDVLARCEPVRDCAACGLWGPCRGRAKRWAGFLGVADVLAQQGRSGREAFEAEMLCVRPSRDTAVYPMFDERVHVRAVEADPSLRWIGGMDFGLNSPLVMLWAQLRPIGDRAGGGGRVSVQVIDEHHRRQWTLDRHLSAIESRAWPRVAWIGADPAGHARSSQTGESEIDQLRKRGYRVRTRAGRIASGIALVQSRLDPAAGEATLIVHPRCVRLIAALRGYHYPPDDPDSETPVKGEHDHAADALRYMVMNLDAATGEARWRRY